MDVDSASRPLSSNVWHVYCLLWLLGLCVAFVHWNLNNCQRHRPVKADQIQGFSAVRLAVLVDVDSAFCLFYHLNCLRHIFQLWHFEQLIAFPASYPPVGGLTAEQPAAAASWTLCNNLHQQPFPKSQCWNPKPAQTKNILAANLITIHHKLSLAVPIISPYCEHYCFKQRKYQACRSGWYDFPWFSCSNLLT